MNGMDFDTVLGIFVVLVSLAAMLGLVLWSRRTINRIARNALSTAREIMQEFRRDE
jgi:hypothetical protein